jgi:chitodextrinase
MSSHINAHFDKRVITIFIIVFIISGTLLAFNMNTKSKCLAKEFDVKAPSLKEGELITFTDNTPDAYNWKWSFGDGEDASYRSKTAHSYSKPGKYTVKLIVNDGCTVEKEITILPSKEVLNKALVPVFYAPNTVYQGDEIKFTDSTKHAKSWEWRFGDGNKIDATESNPTHVYRIPGEKVVSLVVNGDIKYVAYQKVTVLPAKKDKKDWVKDKIPEAPTRGPEIGGLTEAKFRSILLGISEDKLSYSNMTRYLCEDNLPLVQLKDGKTISLKELDKDIRKRNIKIKNLSLHKDKDECVTLIVIDYKHKSLF